MVTIRNTMTDQVLCRPGTDTPFTFKNAADAQDMISRLGLANAVPYGEETEEEPEERYGGEDDLW